MLTTNDDILSVVKNNLLVIDPNKIIDNYNKVADRYVKQEDLIMYANLKAVIKQQTGVYVGPNGSVEKQNNTDKEINLGEVRFNLLNPQDKNANGQYEFKNVLTNQYLDYEGKGYSDTFGIQSISINQNASLVSQVNITFVDVQGRTLMERGNEENNPYNLFYTFPYPQFILTVKGYYGMTVDYPLYLLKTNNTFDSSTGNYTVTCEFLSRTYGVFNSFYSIYGLIAPYLIKLDTGEYLGTKLLKRLYELQNADIASKYANQPDMIRALTIDGAPTMIDLYTAIDSLTESGFGTNVNSLSIKTTIDTINNSKIRLENSRFIIGNAFNNKNTSLIDNELKAIVTTLQNLSPILPAIDNDIKLYSSYTQSVFNKNIEDTITKINKELSILNEKLVNEQVSDIKNKLGFEPSIRNITRVLLNSMEVFLYLLSEVSFAAKSQLFYDGNRRDIHINTIKQYAFDTINGKNLYPFPNYYKDNNGTPSKIYPGEDQRNVNWSEVYFIDEIYRSIQVIKDRISPEMADQLGISQILTGHLDPNKAPKDKFISNNEEDILAEIILDMYVYFTSKGYSLLENNLNDDVLDNIAQSFIDFQIQLLEYKIAKSDKNAIYSTISKMIDIINRPNSNGDALTSLKEYFSVKVGDKMPSIIKEFREAFSKSTDYVQQRTELNKIYAKYNLTGNDLYSKLLNISFDFKNKIESYASLNNLVDSVNYNKPDISKSINGVIKDIIQLDISDGILNQQIFNIANSGVFIPTTHNLSENNTTYKALFIENAFKGLSNYTSLIK